MKPKSKSQIEEELLVARKIAGAISFSAHLRLSPFEVHTTRDLPNYEAAAAEAERLTAKHGRFARRAVVYAVFERAVEEMCTPELIALARSLPSEA